MAKYFIDVVQDSPRTGLGLPVPLLALVVMFTTAWMASTVDLPFRKPDDVTL